MNIQGANILVTGGAGLIGSATVDLLLREHAPRHIVILDNLVRGNTDNLRQALIDPRVHFVQGDICNASTVQQAMQGMDAVVHLAALRITACAADTRRAMQVMCDGSFNVVDAASAAGVQRVVAASSASIYGLAESFPTREDHHPYNNDTWYGASKVMLEGLLRSYHAMHGLRYAALRYFNVYGPRMDIHGKYTEVLIRWMERIAAGQPPLILGDGLQTMDFVFIDDVARANVLALQSESAAEAFNVASGTETSLRELAQRLLQVMGAPGMQPEHGPERSVNAVTRRLACTQKASQLLGFKAQVDLNQGLRQLVNWWHDQRALAACA
jgi:UDP-glucose 4-epimerase